MKSIINRYIGNKLSQNAYKILRDRYFLKDGDSNYLEKDWSQIALRVARHVASAEILYTQDILKIREAEATFYDLIQARVFLPNSPTLFNCGKTMKRELFEKPLTEMSIDDYKEIFSSRTHHNMLSACFVVPMDDSMNGIFDAVKNAALIMKYGGGVGYDFSALRPKGSSIAGTGGKSSGPISFMHVFNTSASTIEQGGARRAAQMAVLNYRHPDVLDFINAKKDNDGKSVLNYFNISVNIDNKKEFLQSLENDSEIELFHKDSNIRKTVKAAELLEKITSNAWKSGDPGILFLGEHNKFYAMADHTPVCSTNPCGEEPLPPYGSCNLGSIDIAKLINDIDFNSTSSESIETFREIVYWCVRFLDNVIDVNVYPLEQIDKVSKEQRFIGLGLMGMADALYMKDVAYNSEEGRKLMARITAILAYYSHLSSSELAKERGNFPEFNRSRYKNGFIPFPMLDDDYDDVLKFWNNKIREHFSNEARFHKRNVQTNTVAPTGSISNIADTSSGIEPNFMLAYVRYMTDKEGNRVPLPYINSVLVQKLNSHFDETLQAEIIEKGSIKDINEISQEIKDVFVTSMDISPMDHLLAQHVVQSYLDASCSKTINMPKSTSVQEVYSIYRKALELNIKGITIYRDGSLETQVLTSQAVKDGEQQDKKIAFFVIDEKHKLRAKPRKETLKSVTRRYKTQTGTVYITVSFDDNGEAVEIFLSDGTETAEVIGRLSSIALRSGVSAEEVIEQLTKVKGSYCSGLGKEIKSAIDDFSALWKTNISSYEILQVGTPKTRDEIEKFVKNNSLKFEKGYYTDSEGNIYCPSCLSKNSLAMTEGCTSCKTCGWSKCS